MFPMLSTAAPIGWLNRASLPAPSLLPACKGLPANVVTTQSVPVRVSLRIVSFCLSTTYMVSELSTARPCGELNRAALPAAATLPGAARQRYHDPCGRDLPNCE